MKGDLKGPNENGDAVKLATARELFPQLGQAEARAGDRGELRFRTGPPAGATADRGLAGTGRGSCSSPTVLLSSCPLLFPLAEADGSQRARPPSWLPGTGGEDGAGRRRRWRWRTPRPKKLLSGVWGGVSGLRGLHGLGVRRESGAEPVESCHHRVASTS